LKVAPIIRKRIGAVEYRTSNKKLPKKYITVSLEIEWFGIITQHFIVVKFCMISKKNGILN